EQARAVDRLAADGATGLDRAHLDVAELGEAFLERGGGRRCRGVAPVEGLAGAFVDDERGDGGKWLAIHVKEDGVGERGEESGGGGKAQPRAAHAAEDGRREGDERDGGDAGEKLPGEKRREAHGPVHPTGPAVRAAPARAPGRPCSCR